MNSHTLEVRGVSHTYGKRPALRDVTLDADQGVLGLLGPNGAGKSTLMRLLGTLMPLQTGDIRVAGYAPSKNPNEVRRHLGYLPQRFDLLPFASVRRNVEFSAWAREVSPDEIASASEDALRRVDLWDQRDLRCRALSGGMRQRLGIACAVVHRPAVLLLDEPTVGLDPLQRVGLRALIKTMAEDALVVVSTHVLEDLSSLASDVVVLGGGEVLATGDMEDLAAKGKAYPMEGMSDIEAGYSHILSGKQ